MRNNFPECFTNEKRFKSLAKDLLQNDTAHNAVLRYICIAMFEHDALSALKTDIEHGETFASSRLYENLIKEGAQPPVAADATGYLLAVSGQTDNIIEEFLNKYSPSPASGPAPMTPVIFGNYEWLVLEEKDGLSLLLSASVLEKHPFNIMSAEITWENCSLRDYLNSVFINKFSQEEKSLIAPIEIPNSSNPWYSETSGGKPTVDSVFLLSLDEVVRYFGDSGKLRDDPPSHKMWISDPGYDKLRIARDITDTPVVWWLRSPGDTNRNAAAVMGNGFIAPGGFDASNGEGGVRPAMWIQDITIDRPAGLDCNFTMSGGERINQDCNQKNLRNT